jgi:hypothetical protein
MAKIFSVPKEIKEPKFSLDQTRADHDKDVERYKNECRELIKKNGWTGKHSGEIISYQVADGFAQYMVVSVRPVQLLHLSYGDGYRFEMESKIDAKEIERKIKQSQALKKIFS